MIKIWPDKDLDRHLALLRLIAVVAAILVWVSGRNAALPRPTPTPPPKPKSPPAQFQVRAQAPAPKAPARRKTGSGTDRVPARKPPTTQAGRMEKGEELPALDLDFDAPALYRLASKRQVLLLASRGAEVWKILPRANDFRSYQIERYRESDARELSSRAIPLSERNAWGIDLQDIRRRLAAVAPQGGWRFEIRLGANLDRRIAQAQRAQKQNRMTPVSTHIRIWFRDGEMVIQATGETKDAKTRTLHSTRRP